MSDKIINRILNIVIIIILTIIISLIIFNVSKDNETHVTEEEKFTIVNSYEELDIAYNIIKKYLLCYANEDYDRLKTYVEGKVDKDVFLENCDCFSKEEWLLADIFVKEQKKTYDGKYIIKYNVNDKYNLEMIYMVNQQNYSFYILYI